MAASFQQEDSHWEWMTVSIDLLFARVGDMERVQAQMVGVQNQMTTQLDLSAQIMDQMLRDQATLAKQMDTTGQTVSRLANQFSDTNTAPHHRPVRIGAGLNWRKT